MRVPGRSNQLNRNLDLKPLSSVQASRWSPPKDFSLVEQVREIPVAESELLHLSHHLPIAMRVLSGEPIVVAIVDPNFLRTSKVSRAGRWLPAYIPIALRGLPFWPLTADGSCEPQVATALGLIGETGHSPLRAPDGQPSQQTQAVVRALKTVGTGIERLKEAANALMIADLLVRLELPDQDDVLPVTSAYFTVDENRFDARSGYSMSAAVRNSFLTLDLAGACLFSRRHLSAKVTWRSTEMTAPLTAASGNIESMLRAREPIPFSLDNSETFDIAHLMQR